MMAGTVRGQRRMFSRMVKSSSPLIGTVLSRTRRQGSNPTRPPRADLCAGSKTGDEGGATREHRYLFFKGLAPRVLRPQGQWCDPAWHSDIGPGAPFLWFSALFPVRRALGRGGDGPVGGGTDAGLAGGRRLWAGQLARPRNGPWLYERGAGRVHADCHSQLDGAAAGFRPAAAGAGSRLARGAD